MFDREDELEKMNSRLETLLEKFDFKDRKESEIEDVFKCNFDFCDAILKMEREKSFSFLAKVIEKGKKKNEDVN